QPQPSDDSGSLAGFSRRFPCWLTEKTNLKCRQHMILFATWLTAIPLLGAEDPSYVRDVRPILDKNCISCHQPASKQSELDLTSYDTFQAGGRRGPAFVAGSPEQSLVIQFITAALKPSMPFGQPPLAANDVVIIRDWIKSGARDDSPSDTVSTLPGVYHQPPV